MRQRRRGKWKRLLIVVALLAVSIAAWWWAARPGANIGPAALTQVPLLLQGNYDTAIAVFSGEDKSVATSGCGAVSMAMAIGYLTGDAVSPEALFQWACDNNHYYGDGLSHEALSEMARNYNLRGTWVDNGDSKAVKRALKAGYPVVAHMGPGTFTQGGHYILLRGLEGEDSVLVNDPQSVELSRESYPLSMIQSELRREKSFMVITPA